MQSKIWILPVLNFPRFYPCPTYLQVLPRSNQNGMCVAAHNVKYRHGQQAKEGIMQASGHNANVNVKFGQFLSSFEILYLSYLSVTFTDLVSWLIWV